MTFGESPKPRHSPEFKRRGWSWFCLSGHPVRKVQKQTLSSPEWPWPRGYYAVGALKGNPRAASPAPSRSLPLLDNPTQPTPHLCVSFLTHRSVGGKKRIRKAETDLVSKQQIKTLQVAEEPQPRKCNDAELGKAGNELALQHIPLRSLLYDRAFRAENAQATGYTDSRLCVK